MQFRMIFPKDLKEIQANTNCIIVDIRAKTDYEREHWKGAYHLPEEEFDKWKNRLPYNKRIILYCSHGASSATLARELGWMGYACGSVLGGWEAMEKYNR